MLAQLEEDFKDCLLILQSHHLLFDPDYAQLALA